MNAAAIFDLDGTLLPWPSLERRFLSYLRRRGGPGARQWFGWLAQFFLRLPAGWCAATEANKSYLAGVPDTALCEFAGWVQRNPLPIFTAAQEQLLWHARQGHRLVLLSGTLQPLAEIFAATLPVPVEVHATAIARKAGRLTGQLAAQQAGEVLSGLAKVRVLSLLASEHRLDLTRSYAYGDRFADRWLLECVGNPVAVNPSWRLARLARQRGWAIRCWQEKLIRPVPAAHKPEVDSSEKSQEFLPVSVHTQNSHPA
jgi:phosphoserine phosphatase